MIVATQQCVEFVGLEKSTSKESDDDNPKPHLPLADFIAQPLLEVHHRERDERRRDNRDETGQSRGARPQQIQIALGRPP